MKTKSNKIFKLIWLFIFILSSLIFSILFYFDEWEQAKPMLFVIPASLFFYFVRKQREKKAKES